MNIGHNKHHSVVILPGLSDGVSKLKWATNWWRKKGLEPHVLRVGWHDGSGDFQTKLNNIIKFVDNLANQGKVSIIGVSAGGSAALNTFLERPDVIERAVSICGRLRAGQHHWRSLEKMSSTSEEFKHSVLLFEKSEPYISDKLKLKIMTVTTRFGDQLVPADTNVLEGAYNIKVPIGEHMLSIGMSLTLFAKPIIDFIRFGRVKTDKE